MQKVYLKTGYSQPSFPSKLYNLPNLLSPHHTQKNGFKF